MKSQHLIPDRKTPPGINPVKMLNWHNPERDVTSNGIRIFIFRDPSIDAVQANLCFFGGIYSEQKSLTAATVANTLREGTEKNTSRRIAEKFDFWGSYLKTTATRDSIEISLFFLNRYAKENLELLAEMVCEPLFPEKEVALSLRNRLEEWRISNEQVAFLSRVLFFEKLFGKRHPYGHSVREEDFSRLEVTDLADYHKKFLGAPNGFCVVSGNVTEPIHSLIKSTLEKLPVSKQTVSVTAVPADGDAPSEYHIDKSDALQTSINIGKRLFNRNHKDYTGFQILNTLLGGYFGSRLMQNLREEKGLTYGIYSSLVSLRFDGVFSISTEVASESTDTTIKEILREVERLRNDLIPRNELSLVKNYYMGNLLQTFDGVMNKADLARSLLITGTPFGYFSRLLKVVKAVTPETLRSLAVKYLAPESFFIVSAGMK